MKNNEIYNLIINGLKSDEDVLKKLLSFDNFLYAKISESAVKYGNGVHPKHRVTKYHDFFVENVEEDDSVLDLGSGRGDVTYDVAKKTKKEVVGIEINRRNINNARNKYKLDNLKFVHGDIYKDIPNKHFDVVMMSNVLEHLKNRSSLLKDVCEMVTPKKVLIRVPHFEREWMVPIKEELKVEYRLDRTHYIEHTYEEFYKEMSDANLKVVSCKSNWGEIWSICEVIDFEKR